MSDITSAAPAGASEQAPAPAPLGPMSVSAAAERLAEFDRDNEAPADAGPGAAAAENIDTTPSNDPPAPDADEPPEETADPSKDAETPAPEAETDPDDEAEVVIHGNSMLVLRDGTRVRASDARKAIGELRELREQLPELNAAKEQAAQYKARDAEIAQREQFVQQVLPLALQRLQAQIPPMPDPALLQSDPIQWMQDKANHERAIAELQQMQTAVQQQAQQAQQQQQEAQKAAYQKVIQDGRRVLLEKIPDMADPAKGKAIYEGLVATAGKYGITKEMVDSTPNPHVFHMIHDLSQKAAAYDRLMAQKPAATAKAKAAPPVAQPGRRVSGAESAARQYDEQIKRARTNGGNINDITAILASLD